MITLSRRNEWQSHWNFKEKKDLFKGVVCVCVHALSCSVSDSFPMTPWTAVTKISSMKFSRQSILEWAAVPASGDLPGPGTQLASLVAPALTGKFFTNSATWEALKGVWNIYEHRLLSYNCLYSSPSSNCLFKSPFQLSSADHLI